MINSKSLLGTLTATILTPLLLFGTTHKAFSQTPVSTEAPASEVPTEVSEPSTQAPASDQGQANAASKRECFKQLGLTRQQKMQLMQLKQSSAEKQDKFEQFIGMLSPSQKGELKQCMSNQ
jgi:hypothetical protein